MADRAPRERILSEDTRQRLRDAALRNRPWERSTGPRTAAGKARSASNALKHGRETNARRVYRRLALKLLGRVERVLHLQEQSDSEIQSVEVEISSIAGAVRQAERRAWEASRNG